MVPRCRALDGVAATLLPGSSHPQEEPSSPCSTVAIHQVVRARSHLNPSKRPCSSEGDYPLATVPIIGSSSMSPIPPWHHSGRLEAGTVMRRNGRHEGFVPTGRRRNSTTGLFRAGRNGHNEARAVPATCLTRTSKEHESSAGIARQSDEHNN